MASLTLIRHGQSTDNLANLFTGNVDVPLTPLGKEEALQELQTFAALKNAQPTTGGMATGPIP